MSGPVVKTVLVGDGAVGKTSLLITFTTNSFPGEYIPTVFDNYTATVCIEDRFIQNGLWDSVGGAQQPLRALTYPQSDVVVIAYFAGHQQSFDNIVNLYLSEVKKYAPNAPIILAGLKEDLREDKVWQECQRKRGQLPNFLPSEKGDKMVGTNNIVAHRLVSALYGLGVCDLFHTAIRAALAQQSPAPAKVGLLSGLFKESKPKAASRCFGHVPYVAGRLGAAIISARNGRTVVVGGTDSNGKFEETALLHITAGAPYPQVHVEAPRRKPEFAKLLQRNFAGCCSDGQHGFIVGGKSEGRYLNDVIHINLDSLEETSLRIDPISPLPSPRYGHT